MPAKENVSTLPQKGVGGSRFLRPQDLRRFKDFQFAARMVVEGFYAGRHRSPFYDAAAEFADYRPYVPGDEIRALDWRACARTDRDYIKLFRKETDMRCHILLDTSRSMAFCDAFRAVPDTKPGVRRWWQQSREWTVALPRFLLSTRHSPDTPLQAASDQPLSKFEYGAYLTAGLAYLTIQQGDKASLALGGARLQTYVPPGGTITHLHGLLHQLEIARPDGPTQIAGALQSLFALARRRGLLVVLSDFLEDTDALFHALSLFTHRGWQVVLLHILTETEIELPSEEGNVRYLDPEQPGHLDADPDTLRAAYKAEMRQWFDTLENEAKARRILYSRMTTTTPYDQGLERYLTTRARA
jgi:uncharacterized protein (DUF58 family)